MLINCAFLVFEKNLFTSVELLYNEIINIVLKICKNMGIESNSYVI